MTTVRSPVFHPSVTPLTPLCTLIMVSFCRINSIILEQRAEDSRPIKEIMTNIYGESNLQEEATVHGIHS